ncbi:MAG TPA: hypothetical protein ENI73_07730 [Spirochaetes bacterium]|nr:hypothetical protein [Spirochaetota bacterium]
MIYIHKRIVKIATGTKSQTINICTEDNIHGEYDYILRIMDSKQFTSYDELTVKQFSSIDDLINSIQKDHHGIMEKSSGKTEQVISILDEAKENIHYTEKPSEWEEKAKEIVEKSIDQFILDFIDFPYLHRVEHSIHCELYNILSNGRLLGNQYPLGDHSISQAVHKEWPEYKPRPEKGNRRGNFDLSILSPEQLKRSTIKDFRYGRIKPFIAMELGLDYKLDHLDQDLYKLKNSEIQYGYLIHLIREQYVSDHFNDMERFILEEIHDPVKVAYARISDSMIYYKLVQDKDIKAIPIR